MKKNLFIFAKNSAAALTLLVLIIAPFQPLVAQALTLDQASVNNSVQQQQYNNCLSNNAGDTTFCTQSANNQMVDAAGNTIQQPGTAGSVTGASATGNSGSTGCGLNPSTWDLCITDVVYVFTVGIGSGFAYISAYFFDWAIALSLNGGSYALDFVSQGWTTARDIANMAFLFILLYIAFKIIFQAETNETVHMLTIVIVVALLVNFSFFFTRLAIDAGNILSIQFYNAIQVPAVSATAAGQTAGALSNSANPSMLFANSNSKDLTASIMGMLNLQGLFSSDSFKNWYAPGGAQTAPGFMVVVISLTFLYIAAGIMFWILTVAFITNGVKFLYRIVILWFLIIASPLAFVARAVPKFEEYYKKWQSALISHAFYPAAFMFIFLILTNFSKQMSQNNNLINGLFNGLQGANAASPVAAIGYAAANVFIRLGFVIAMLYVGMEASKKIGLMGADAAEHAGNWVGGKMTGAFKTVGAGAGRGVVGGLGWTGRNTVGMGASAVANSVALKKLESRTGLVGLFGRGTRAAFGSVGRASFDARNAPVLGKTLGNSLGKAQKGGYETSLKERTEAKEKRMKAVEPSEGQKMQARKQAEEETGYAGHSAKYNDSKTKRDAANARLQALVEGGHEDSAEATTLRAEVDTHQKSANVSYARMKVLEDITKARAKEISGEDLKKEYANTLVTRNIRNLWMPVRSSYEATAKIRKGKSKAEKVLEEAQKALKESDAEEKKEEAEAPETKAPAKEEEGGHDEH